MLVVRDCGYIVRITGHRGVSNRCLIVYDFTIIRMSVISCWITVMFKVMRFPKNSNSKCSSANTLRGLISRRRIARLIPLLAGVLTAGFVTPVCQPIVSLSMGTGTSSSREDGGVSWSRASGPGNIRGVVVKIRQRLLKILGLLRIVCACQELAKFCIDEATED